MQCAAQAGPLPTPALAAAHPPSTPSTAPPHGTAGYWSNSSSNLPAPRSDFAAVLLPGAAQAGAAQALPDLVLVLGGLDAQGAPVDSVLSYNAVLDM